MEFLTDRNLAATQDNLDNLKGTHLEIDLRNYLAKNGLEVGPSMCKKRDIF
jgi:hypothetical protein